MTTKLSGGASGETVEYEIVVNNTGEVPVTVEKVEDSGVPACATSTPESGCERGEEAVESIVKRRIRRKGDVHERRDGQGQWQGKERRMKSKSNCSPAHSHP